MINKGIIQLYDWNNNSLQNWADCEPTFAKSVPCHWSTGILPLSAGQSGLAILVSYMKEMSYWNGLHLPLFLIYIELASEFSAWRGKLIYDHQLIYDDVPKYVYRISKFVAKYLLLGYMVWASNLVWGRLYFAFLKILVMYYLVQSNYDLTQN